MRKVVLSALISLAMIPLAALPAQALPSEDPDNTWMLDGPAGRALAAGAGKVFIGGQFTEALQNPPGSSGDSRPSTSVVAFDAGSGTPAWTAQVTHTSATPIVYSLAVSPDEDTLYVCGRFNRVNGNGAANLAALSTANGNFIPSFDPNAATCWATFATNATVWAGGSYLKAFTASGGDVGSFDANVDGRVRSIEGGAGSLFVAGHFDHVNGQNRPAVAKIDADTGNTLGWTPQGGVGVNAFGIDLFLDGGVVYLAAGGSDFAAKYDASSGNRFWRVDTNGSVQAITPMGTDVIIGGHFKLVAPNTSIGCGVDQTPEDCIKRLRLAALDSGGRLIQSWDAPVTGNFHGVWATLVTGGSLHLAGQFKKVNGQPQFFYARLS